METTDDTDKGAESTEKFWCCEFQGCQMAVKIAKFYF